MSPDRTSSASRPTIYAKEKRSLGTSKVPKLWKHGTNTRSVYLTQCFWRSFLYAVDESRRSLADVWLVHGESNFASGPHAWVDLPGGWVFDAVYQRWYPCYYDQDGQQASAWYKFRPDAAMLIYNELRDYELQQNPHSTIANYCFNEFLWLPWGNGKNPLLIDYAGATKLLETREARRRDFPLPIAPELRACVHELLGTRSRLVDMKPEHEPPARPDC